MFFNKKNKKSKETKGKNKNRRNFSSNQTPKKTKPVLKQITPLTVGGKKDIKTKINLTSSDNKVYFGALGGMGDKIGCNLYLYGTRGEWIIVDAGIGFPTERMAGAEYVIPDTSFLKAIKGRIKALLLTHSHEDHYGAIPYIIGELNCPIYGTPFALKMLENKLIDNDLLGKVTMRKVNKEGAKFKLGPFEIEYFHITHSIPQANGIIIRTEQGALLHTGDWKFDPTPLMDGPTDMTALKNLGRENVLAVMCDSTNALEPEHSRSEKEVVAELEKVVKTIKHGKLVITCFSTNVVRMESIFKAAKAAGRKLVVLGRSMERNIDISISEGYLKDFQYITADDAIKIDDNKALYLVTGTQGEPRSVLTRVSEGSYRDLKLRENDTVIFSSKIIPGNEESIFAVQNNLSKNGINVVTTMDNPNIHASGHGSKVEIAELYKMLKPQIVIPVHGEPIHLFRNAKIANECKIKNVEIINNGDFIELIDGEKPRVVEVVPTGQIIIDGTRHISATNEVFQARRKINYNGAIFISLAISKSGLVGKPDVSSFGVFETDSTGMIKSSIVAEIKNTLKSASKKDFASDGTIKEMTVASVRRVIRELMDKKPPISVHIVRV